jgi:RNA polymerase sigma-70 factor (ECF subfamily)
MDAKNPKRRKMKNNPYTIYYTRETDKYYISFTDCQGCKQSLEIDRELFNAFDSFELEDLSEMNEYDRHIEHAELEENKDNPIMARTWYRTRL